MTVVGNGASPKRKNLLNLRLFILGRAGQNAQVFQHVDLAAAVNVTAEDKGLESRVQNRLSSWKLTGRSPSVPTANPVHCLSRWPQSHVVDTDIMSMQRPIRVGTLPLLVPNVRQRPQRP
jgi:hypothetical protein